MKLNTLVRSCSHSGGYKACGILGLASCLVLVGTVVSAATNTSGSDFPGQRRGAGTHFREVGR